MLKELMKAEDGSGNIMTDEEKKEFRHVIDADNVVEARDSHDLEQNVQREACQALAAIKYGVTGSKDDLSKWPRKTCKKRRLNQPSSIGKAANDAMPATAAMASCKARAARAAKLKALRYTKAVRDPHASHAPYAMAASYAETVFDADASCNARDPTRYAKALRDVEVSRSRYREASRAAKVECDARAERIAKDTRGYGAKAARDPRHALTEDLPLIPEPHRQLKEDLDYNDWSVINNEFAKEPIPGHVPRSGGRDWDAIKNDIDRDPESIRKYAIHTGGGPSLAADLLRFLKDPSKLPKAKSSNVKSLKENDVVEMLIELTFAATENLSNDSAAYYMKAHEVKDFLDFMFNKHVEEGNATAHELKGIACTIANDYFNQEDCEPELQQQEPMTEHSYCSWDTILSEFRVDKSSILRHAHAGPGNSRPRMTSQLLRLMRDAAERSKHADLTVGAVIAMMTVLLETANKLKDSDVGDFITAEEAKEYFDLLLATASEIPSGIAAIYFEYDIAIKHACEVVVDYLRMRMRSCDGLPYMKILKENVCEEALNYVKSKECIPNPGLQEPLSEAEQSVPVSSNMSPSDGQPLTNETERDAVSSEFNELSLEHSKEPMPGHVSMSRERDLDAIIMFLIKNAFN
jgi:hypothetical protein